MSGLFPFFGDVVSVQQEQLELPLYKEVAWDFESNSPIVKNGDFVVVFGNEAIKTWCYKALNVARYKLLIYSWDYGCEIESLIGTGYSKILINAECGRFIEDCLLINPYITAISDIKTQFKEGSLIVEFKINTVYGEEKIEGVSFGV